MRHESDGGNFSVQVDTGDVDVYDHADEVAATRKSEKDSGVAPPDLPETTELPVNNPALTHNPADNIREHMEHRFHLENERFKVQVTDVDRDRFVRAALHDEELIFEVELQGIDMTVSVAIPPEMLTTSAASAAKKWGTIGFVDPESDMEWLLSFQQMHAWWQIRAINGTPTAWSSAFDDGHPKLSEIKATLADPDNFDEIFKLSATRWRIIADCLNIAELKYKICLQNWKDRSFFTGADTA